MGFPNTKMLGNSNLMGSAVAPDVEYFDDFLEGGFVADAALPNESDPSAKFIAVANAGVWLVTFDVAPSIVIADDEPGGLLVITTGANAGDFVSCQMNGEAWRPAAGKDIYFEIRMKLDDSDDTRWFVGLATTDVAGTTLGPILDGVVESIGFRQAGAAAQSIIAVMENGSTETTQDTGIDVADDTYVTLGFHLIGNQRCKYYVNGAEKAVLATNIPDGDAVTLSMEVGGPTASSTLEVDYIYCAQKR